MCPLMPIQLNVAAFVADVSGCSKVRGRKRASKKIHPFLADTLGSAFGAFLNFILTHG
jgi:hypothetical protein